MFTYWLTTRISEKTVNRRSYEDRYKALQEAIRTCKTKWWVDPTSFYVFESDCDLESLAASFKKAIEPSHDVFLIRKMDDQSAMICGKTEDQDIFNLMPYLKRL